MDDDIEQLWWDDHVSIFPAQYYKFTLLSPEDYNVLFSDDEDDDNYLDPLPNDNEEEFSFSSYTTAEASQLTDASLTLVLSETSNYPVDDEQFHTVQDTEDQGPINLIHMTRPTSIYTTRKIVTTDHHRSYDHDHASCLPYALNHATCWNYAATDHANRKYYATDYANRKYATVDDVPRKYVNYHAPLTYGSYLLFMKYTSAMQISAAVAAFHSNFPRDGAASINVNKYWSYNLPETIGYKDEIFFPMKRKEEVKEVTPAPGKIRDPGPVPDNWGHREKG